MLCAQTKLYGHSARAKPRSMYTPLLSQDEAKAQALELRIVATASHSLEDDFVTDIPLDCVEIMQEAKSWLDGLPSDQVQITYPLGSSD